MRRYLLYGLFLALILCDVPLSAQRRLTLGLEEAIATAHDQSPMVL